LACAFDDCGLALQGLQGFAAIATGVPKAAAMKPLATKDLMLDFECNFIVTLLSSY